MTIEIDSGDRPSAAVRAEAAAWLAHLRGPDKTPGIGRGFRLWLSATPEHARAFELATEAWERSAALQRRPQERPAAAARRAAGLLFVRWATVVAGIVAVFLALFLYSHAGVVGTGMGEQRALILADGSRINLNTDTRVVVEYDARRRRVRLDRGEASFEVAHNAERPFIVSAGATQIEAIGTSFIVRRDGDMLAVTLVEGHVKVEPIAASGPPTSLPNAEVLNPGERLTFSRHVKPEVDRPSLDRITAWQRGQVVFDNVPLSDAIAEMNRYSITKLAIESPESNRIRIGGVFRAGDAASFAEAIAANYHLRIVEGRASILLAGAPISR